MQVSGFRRTRRGLSLAVMAVVLAGGLPGVVSLPQAVAQAAAHATGRAHEGRMTDGGQQSTPEANSAEASHAQEDESEQYRHSAVVQKLASMLHMSPAAASTLFTLINLAILVIAVGAALVKMLPKAFRSRTSTIQKQLVDARTATEEANARLGSVEERLRKLDGQIAEMKTQAEKDAVRDEQRMKASVEDEKAKILAAAEAEITSATALARREIQQYAAHLAVEQAARKLVVTPETDRLLVENFAQKLGAGKGDSGKAGRN